MEIFASCFFLTSRWRWRCRPAVPSPECRPTSSCGPAGSGALASVGLQRSPGVLPQRPEHRQGTEGRPGAQEEGAGYLSLGICCYVHELRALDFNLQRDKQESRRCRRKKSNCYLNWRTQYNELTAMLCNFMICLGLVRTLLGCFWFVLALTLRSDSCYQRLNYRIPSSLTRFGVFLPFTKRSFSFVLTDVDLQYPVAMGDLAGAEKRVTDKFWVHFIDDAGG